MHIVNQKEGHFEPDRSRTSTKPPDRSDRREARRQTIVAKERPRAEKVADLMDARLRPSVESSWCSSKKIRRMVER